MQFCVLGPLEVYRDGESVTIGSPRQQAVLAALLVRAGEAVPVDVLAGALWGTNPPADPRNAIQTYVARLRATLGEGAPLETAGRGYRLAVADGGQLDARRFEELIDEAVRRRGEDPEAARRMLDEALGLWRGEPYGRFADSFAAGEALRLRERRQMAVEERAAARLAVGESGAVVGELRAWVTEHPLRERAVTLLMRALAAQERPTEALAAFRTYRDRLAEETGLEPSPAVEDLHTRILRGELDRRPGAADGPAGSDGSGSDESGDGPAGADRPAIPAVASPLVGRGELIARVRDQLARRRLVTLTGPGGVGKTRVAVAVASQLAGDREVVWVDLAPLSEPSAVGHVVADAAGVDVAGGKPPREALIAGLRARELLVVLDNCEHVLAAAAPLAERLYRACPGLEVLATSRERLAVDGEQVLPVHPLGVGQDPDGQAGSPAVRLFLDRAAAAAADLDLSGQLPVVARICRSLDGLPLAIELAAARAGTVGVRELAEALEAGREVGVGHRRGVQGRHRDLRAVVDWSSRLLDPDQRRLFDQLSVFAGAFTVDDAHAVCAADEQPRHATVEQLAGLAEASMLAGPLGARGRYRMLQTLRRCGRERLADRGEAGAVADRHAAVLVDRAEQVVGTRLGASAEARRWLRGSFDDLREAHRRARLTGNVDLAARLTAALYRFEYWRMRAEVMSWARSALRLEDIDAHRAAPQVYAAAAAAAWMRGELEEARRLAGRGTELGAGGDDPARRFAYEALGDVASFQGRLEEAEAAWREEIRLARLADDADSEVLGLGGAALALAYRGRTAEALEEAAEAERVAARASPAARAFAGYAQGEVRAESEPGRALGLIEEAVELAGDCGASFIGGVARVTAASLRGRHGDPAAAVPAFAALIRHWRDSGSWTQQWTTLRNLAELLVRMEVDEPAVVLLARAGAAETAPASFGAEADRTRAALARARGRLGEEVFQAARQRGAWMDDQSTVALALATLDELAGA